MLNHHHYAILLLIYVDDFLVTGTNPTQVDELILKLGAEFVIKDLGCLHYFLGIEARYFLGAYS